MTSLPKIDVDIDIEGLHFQYSTDAEFVLSNLSMKIDKGVFVGIVGPNGCGKTTLLKCIINFLRPNHGDITIQGQAVRKIPQRHLARKIGVVPQNWDLNFAFSAEEIVMMGRFPHQGRLSIPSELDRQIVHDVMELTNISHLAQRNVSQVSGGELQRIIIAQSIAQQPEILLLDEATSNLDINHQAEILDLIKSLNSTQHLSVVSVMHDLNLAAQYCDVIIMLKNGQVFATGPPGDVLSRQNIKDVYDATVRVRKDPLTNRPYIGPFADSKQKQQLDVKLHIIGGGGTSGTLLELLYYRGYTISCGVLNRSDSDWEVARDLDIPCISELAFSPISQQAYEQNIDHIRTVSAVVLTCIPFGHGNLLNLASASQGLKLGLPVILCDFQPITDRDFTDGQASRCYNQLIKDGAIPITSLDKLWETLAVIQ